MAKPTSKTELLTTHLHELTKVYVELDGQDRPYKTYTAHTDAVDGAQCIVTEYIYASPTSTQVIARKEAYDEWDATWDADFTVTTS